MPLLLFIYPLKVVVLGSIIDLKVNINVLKFNIKLSFFDISASIFNIIGLKNNMFLA